MSRNPFLSYNGQYRTGKDANRNVPPGSFVDMGMMLFGDSPPLPPGDPLLPAPTSVAFGESGKLRREADGRSRMTVGQWA